jgi:hypothetical protein
MCTKITCSAGSVLVSSANTTIGGNETLCCAQLAVHEITLAGTLTDLIAQYGSIDKFKASFSSAIAKQISTPGAPALPADVIVTNVLSGSIKVQFYINSTSAALDKQLSQRLPAALANKTLQLSATSNATTVSMPLTVSSFKAGKTKDPIVFAPAQSITVQPVAPAPPPAPPVTPAQSAAPTAASTAPPGPQEDSSTGTIVVAGVVVLVLAGGVAAFLKFKGGKTTSTTKSPGGETDYEQTENPMHKGGTQASNQKTLWKAITDQNTGKEYYVNRQTRETTWTKPADFDAQLTGGSGGSGGFGADKEGDGLWKEVVDAKTGRPYYVNRQTKETTWTKPAGA